MAHRHYGYDDDVSLTCVELTPDICLREMRRHDGKVMRFVIAHDSPAHPDGYRCEGTIPVTGDRAWSVSGSLAGGDLTLSPSILEPASGVGAGYCPGYHGWVRSGRWVPA